MRAAITISLMLFSAPAFAAGECKFYNSAGQNLEWKGNTVVVDPLYMDAYECPLTPIDGTDAYMATCGTWTETLVIGYADNPQGANALVWQNIFYWRKCDKDRA